MSKRDVARQERAEAQQELRKMLKPGMRVYCILKHRSASGMNRVIDLVIPVKGEIHSISFKAAKAMGDKWDHNRGGIRIGGCGMDMGFALVYNLGATLWPKGTSKPHGTRNGQPDSAGGYALKSEWL